MRAVLGLRLITTLAIHFSRYVYYYRLIRIQSMVAVESWTPLAIASLRYIFVTLIDLEKGDESGVGSATNNNTCDTF